MGYAAGDDNINPLKTDLYQLTMAQGFFNEGTHEKETSYYMHWRMPPFKNAKYSVVAGLEEFIDYLKNFKFTEDDIAYLASIEKKGKPLFTPEFLQYLKDTPLKIDVDAAPEGSIIASAGPVVRVSGPLVQCQIVESIMLNIINRNSIIATRASMITSIAQNIGVALFGLRRAAEIGIGNVRSAFIGGAGITADVDAARKLGIPATGTMAHAWIMNFQDDAKPNCQTELEAFTTYLTHMDNNTVLLVDTYDTKQGIRNAITAAINTGIELDGIRLDSGELAELTLYAKEQLDEAIKTHPELFNKTKVFLTDGLYENKIVTLLGKLDKKHQATNGTEFPREKLAFGIGTELANTGPFRGGVYKVCSYILSHTSEEGVVSKFIKGVMKLAGVNEEDPTLPSSKASIPGQQLDIIHLYKNGKIVAEMIIDHALGDYADMLSQGKAINMADNKTLVELPEFDEARTLLVPVYKRNELGVSEYVHAEPAKKTLTYNPNNIREVTDIGAIQKHHLQMRSALPREYIDITTPDKLPVLIDPRIHQHRIDIIAKTNGELRVASEVSGSLTAAGQQPTKTL